MPGAEPDDPTTVERQTLPCRHLRHQGMYVYTDGKGRDPHANKDYDNTIHWCLKTMKGFGPDDEMVGGADCRDPARSCHEPL